MDIRELYPKRHSFQHVTRPVNIVRYIPGIIGYRKKEETPILSVCSDDDYDRFIDILEKHEREKATLREQKRALESRISALETRLDMCKRLLFAIRSRLKS